MQFRRRKQDKRDGRRREPDAPLSRDRHLVSVSIAAEALSKNFEAVCQRSHSWRGGNFDRSGSSLARRENGGGQPPSASPQPPKKYPQGPPRYEHTPTSTHLFSALP